MRSKLISVLVGLLIALCAYGQQMLDVVHLKNGGQVRGMIIEQVPGVSLKIQTADGSVFVYQMTEVEKTTKEAAPQQRNSSLQNNPSSPEIDVNAELKWKNGKFYLDETQISDQAAKNMLGVVLWDKYGEAYSKWETANLLSDLSLGLGGLGLSLGLSGLIWNNNTLMLVGAIGFAAGLVAFFPAVITTSNASKKVNAVIAEYNYGPGISNLNIILELPKNNTLAFNPTSTLPSYTQLFRISIPF